MEMTVSSTDHVLKVSLVLVPKYDFTSQNPASLTCEKNTDPAPMAIATHSGDAPLLATIPGMTPAAVMVATVAEPVPSRISAASDQARTIGDTKPAPATCANTRDKPAAMSTCL